MCTRYISPEASDIERHWHVGRGNAWRGLQLFPRSPGPFVRAARESTAPQRELVIGQWGLIPWFAKSAKLPYATVNARFEEITAKASFKDSWRHGRRCVIPAWSFDEPCWETGRNVWWRFARADGTPWGLAGLWNTWTDKATGEVVESYTMLTINADAHPLMARMHKPDPKLGPDEQDKRCVVPIEVDDVDEWLFAPIERAKQLVRLPPVERFAAAPAGTPHA
ncbi:MAG: SOS response-associated peptidase family protein [Burkholderiaceae bacterium]